MNIAELVIALAMLVVVVWCLRDIYVNYGRGEFTQPSRRHVVALLLLLTASSAVRVWREPGAVTGWLLLAFNAIAFPLALSVAQWRRRRPVALPAD